MRMSASLRLDSMYDPAQAHPVWAPINAYSVKRQHPAHSFLGLARYGSAGHAFGRFDGQVDRRTTVLEPHRW